MWFLTGRVQEHGWCWDVDQNLPPWFSCGLYQEMVVDVPNLQSYCHCWSLEINRNDLFSLPIYSLFNSVFVKMSILIPQMEERDIIREYVKLYVWGFILRFLFMRVGQYYGSQTRTDKITENNWIKNLSYIWWFFTFVVHIKNQHMRFLLSLEGPFCDCPFLLHC